MVLRPRHTSSPGIRAGYVRNSALSVPCPSGPPFRTPHISRFVPRAVADDGAAFRHAVGDGIGEIDGTHERFHLGVERCAADDDFLDVPPEKAQAFRASFSLIFSLMMGMCRSSLPNLLSIFGRTSFLNTFSMTNGTQDMMRG